MAIVGGGATGFATADALLAAGVRVSVFEARASAGGLGATFTRDGFSFDPGPHELCTDDEALRAWLAELCGEDLLEVEKRAAQHLGGGLVPFPFGLGDVLRGFGPLTVARACRDLALSRVGLGRRGARGSFEDWTLQRLGGTFYDAYFAPYTRKVWGVDPATLDASVAAERIAAESLWEILLQTLRRGSSNRPRRPHSATHAEFLYVRGGIGRLVDLLQARVLTRGGRIETGKRLVGLELEQGSARTLAFDDGTRRGGFSHVVSTIPLPELARIALGRERARAAGADELLFRGMVFVHVRVARPCATGYQWVYYPDPAIPFQRVTDFGQFDGARMCPPEHSALTLEIAADPGDAHWERTDEELFALCGTALADLGVLRPRELVGGNVVRVRHAYPVQAVGFAERVDRVVDALASVADLTTIGRQGLFLYCNMDQCIEMGLRTGEHLASGSARERPAFRSRWRGVGLER